jgi:hypothetical protein
VRKDWLTSLEAADPFEVFVLIFASSSGPKPIPTIVLENNTQAVPLGRHRIFRSSPGSLRLAAASEELAASLGFSTVKHQSGGVVPKKHLALPGE